MNSTVRENQCAPASERYVLRTLHFWRSFTVSDSVDTDKIDATFENGVLTLTLQKAEKAKPKQIALK